MHLLLDLFILNQEDEMAVERLENPNPLQEISLSKRNQTGYPG
jgi:hypothetical protein